MVAAGVAPANLIAGEVGDATGSRTSSSWVSERVYVQDCSRRPVREWISDKIGNRCASAASAVSYHREVLSRRTVEDHVPLPATDYFVERTTAGHISFTLAKWQVI